MLIASPRENPPTIAYLTTIIGKPGDRRLLQNKVDRQWAYLSFAEFAADFHQQAAYPKRQSSKMETYSWLPTVFVESDKNAGSIWGDKPEIGLWRKGEHSAHEVSLFYADLDNHHDDQPMVSFDVVEDLLKSFGLSYILYTSFSHTDTKHKVRIVVPSTRVMTYDEAFNIYQWFSHLLFYQLDGSIYDDGDHLFGPTYGGRMATSITGGALDVDVVLALAGSLDDDVKAKMVRHTAAVRIVPPMTDAQRSAMLARMADHEAAVDVSINNPKYFKPEWLDKVRSRHVGGSHRQTAFGVLRAAWLYSGGSLSLGDMQTLQDGIDCEYSLYLTRKYGAAAMKADLYEVMSCAVTPREVQLDPQQALKLEIEKKKNRYSKFM